MTEKNELMIQLRQKALVLLARREYSCAELRQRLGRVEGADQLLDQLLSQLQGSGMQSDQRFAESFIRSRIGRGQGLIRITQELRHKGIAAEISQPLLEADETDWFELARELFERRFGTVGSDDPKLRAKQLRFLLYRGFSHEQARYAMESTTADE